MLNVDDSDFTKDHREYLRDWAENLGVSVERLLGRIVKATCRGGVTLRPPFAGDVGIVLSLGKSLPLVAACCMIQS